MTHTISTIKPICDKLHLSGKTIVLATGFFDLLHAEHVKFLTKAKAKGDILIVGVESDLRARKLKGEGRPLETQSLRCRRVASHADYVIALPDDFNNFNSFDFLMSVVRPLFFAVSSHTSHRKSKIFLTEKYGGQLLVVHQFNPSISTTKIIKRNQV